MKQPLLPKDAPVAAKGARRMRSPIKIGLAFVYLAAIWVVWEVMTISFSRNEVVNTFHFTKTRAPTGICSGVDGKGESFAGHIGLKGDTDEKPKRSFYWLFEAQEDAENAPVILTVGGGPGTSGLLNPLFGQSHCKIVKNLTTVPNPHAWSEKFNLLALDHPIGVGFSYGTHVNTSEAAADDVYDFLQRFFKQYPHLAKNQLVLAGGSYGGTYIPTIATAINEGNKKVAKGQGQPGAKILNLESMMVSNPMSDFETHMRWRFHTYCNNDIYNLLNQTQCDAAFAKMPQCFDEIQFAYENQSIENRNKALETCYAMSGDDFDLHGRSNENILKKCPGGDISNCFPEFAWAIDFMNQPKIKEALNVPSHLNFTSISEVVNKEFMATGDLVYPTYHLYEQLLKDGIRLLHYIGKLDANCGWHGVLSFLKLLKSKFRDAFREAADIPWNSTEVATVRAIGEGSGNFTYVLLSQAGHMVTYDQPALVKNVVEHWIANEGWF